MWPSVISEVILALTYSFPVSNRLFVAEGDRFVEADTAVFQWDTFGDEDIIAGVDIADIDLDGRMDLVVGHHYNSTVDFDTEVAVRLYLNASDGSGVRFIDVTETAGLVPLPTKAPHVEFRRHEQRRAARHRHVGLRG